MVSLAQALSHLLGTVVMETVLAWLLIPSLGRRGLADVMLVNLFTNPVAHLARAAGVPFLPTEAIVVLVEAVWFRRLIVPTWSGAVALSVALNASTFAASFWIP